MPDQTPVAKTGEVTDLVLLDAIPHVFALYRHEIAPDSEDVGAPEDDGDPEDGDFARLEPGVVGWVFGLPDGSAYLISAGDHGMIVHARDLTSIAGRWADATCADLVWVAQRGPLPVPEPSVSVPAG